MYRLISGWWLNWVYPKIAKGQPSLAASPDEEYFPTLIQIPVQFAPIPDRPFKNQLCFRRAAMIWPQSIICINGDQFTGIPNQAPMSQWSGQSLGPNETYLRLYNVSSLAQAITWTNADLLSIKNTFQWNLIHNTISTQQNIYELSVILSRTILVCRLQSVDRFVRVSVGEKFLCMGTHSDTHSKHVCSVCPGLGLSGNKELCCFGWRRGHFAFVYWLN